MRAFIIGLVLVAIGIKLINLLFTIYDVAVANGHVPNNFELVTRLGTLILWGVVLYAIIKGHIKIQKGWKWKEEK